MCSASSVCRRTSFERLRSLSANVQFSLEHSISDKTAKPAEPPIILSRRRKSVSKSNLQFLPKNQQYLPSNLSGFSPRLSTIESLPATALHSFGSRPCHRLCCSGTFWAHSGLWGPCAQGYLIVWVTGPFDCVVRFILCPLVGLLVYGHGPF